MKKSSLTTSESVIYSHTGLRGIAAMIVFFYHVYSSEGMGKNIGWNLDYRVFRFCLSGWLAVDLFFVLSGFILNWVYLSNEEGLNWSGYLRARVARIMPLYYLMIVLMVPLHLVRHGLSFLGGDYLIKILANIFMVSGIIDGADYTIDSPAWSICVEFFCYLAVFPVLIWINRSLLQKGFKIATFALIACICTYSFVAYTHVPPVSIYHWQWKSMFLVGGVLEFSTGFLLCSIMRMTSNWKPNLLLINLVVLGSITVFVLTRLDYLKDEYFHYVLPLLVFFTAFDKGIVAYILKFRMFQWLGEISYSIYLWHIPVTVCFIEFYKSAYVRLFKTHPPMGLFTFALLVGVVLLISELSYRYFEIPCRQFIRRSGWRNSTVKRA